MCSSDLTVVNMNLLLLAQIYKRDQIWFAGFVRRMIYLSMSKQKQTSNLAFRWGKYHFGPICIRNCTAFLQQILNDRLILAVTGRRKSIFRDRLGWAEIFSLFAILAYFCYYSWVSLHF